MKQPLPSEIKSRRIAIFDQSWSRRTLPSGLRLLHIPTPWDDHFHIGMMIRCGSRFERPEVAGLTHFLEHMMFRGSERYPNFIDLAAAFEWLGGDWNAATSREHTEFWYSGIIHTASDVTELFAEFLSHPKLNDLETERKIITRELEGELNEFGHSTDLDHHISEMFWSDSSMANPILGNIESIKRIDLDQLHRHRNQHFTPDNMVVCIVGGDRNETYLDLLTENFKLHRLGGVDDNSSAWPAIPKFSGPKIRWVEHSDNEYQLQLSFQTAGQWSDNAPVYDIIARVLADGFCSELGRRLREELGLVYDIDCAANLYVDTGSIDINASVGEDDLDQFLNELLRILNRLVANGPDPDATRRAIVRAIIDVELSTGDPITLGERLCWAELCGQEFRLVNERQQFEELEPARIAAAFKSIFCQRNCALVVLGPQSDEQAITDLLTEKVQLLPFEP